MNVEITHWGIPGYGAEPDDPYADIGWSPDCVLVPGNISERLD